MGLIGEEQYSGHCRKIALDQELLLVAPVSGVFAAQQIKPKARTLAVDRGIRCITLDYDEMRGMDSDEYRLF